MISAPNGGKDQSASLPGLTTSVCPRNKKKGLPVPCRAKRLVVPLSSKVMQLKPKGESLALIKSRQPKSFGVMEGILIKLTANLAVIDRLLSLKLVIFSWIL